VTESSFHLKSALGMSLGFLREREQRRDKGFPTKQLKRKFPIPPSPLFFYTIEKGCSFD
jgi:hypothetical protein